MLRLLWLTWSSCARVVEPWLSWRRLRFMTCRQLPIPSNYCRALARAVGCQASSYIDVYCVILCHTLHLSGHMHVHDILMSYIIDHMILKKTPVHTCHIFHNSIRVHNLSQNGVHRLLWRLGRHSPHVLHRGVVVALHADQAAEATVAYAVEQGKAFAVVPCCEPWLSKWCKWRKQCKLLLKNNIHNCLDTFRISLII